MSASHKSFYVTGGAMQRHAPSYVQRQADDDLYKGLMAGRFCYVLTSRQMGKSSLMVRTAERLRAEGMAVVNLDLTAIGQNVTAEQWYNGLLSDVRRKLDPHRLVLDAELKKFWEDHVHLGPLQRWMRAIREVVLERTKDRLVIFVDEIDYVRSLPFSTDEFFAGIREFYNRRAEDPELERLTFCLLGVAIPSDLIRDTRTTPFNIGTRIELADFNEAEAEPLVQGLPRDKATGARLLRRILYWTGGHPYLTQRLCLSVAEDARVTDAGMVDSKCAELFLSTRARESDENLLFVRERILRNEESDRASLLDLYQNIRDNKGTPDDETNLLVSILRLSGITRTVDGTLRVRNRIYYRAFDKAWIMSNMPDAEVQRQRLAYRKGLLRAAAIATIIILALVGLAGAAVHQRNRAERERERAEQERVRAEAALVQVTDSEAKLRRESEEKEQARKSAQEASDRATLETQRTREALDTAKEQRLKAELQANIASAEKLKADEERRLANIEREKAEDATVKANVATDRIRRLLYVANMNLAQQAWERPNVRRLSELLNSQLPKTGEEDLRGFEWHYLWRLSHSELLTLMGHKGSVTSVVFSSDGRHIVTGSHDHTAKIWDAVTGKEILTLKGHESEVSSVAISLNGTRIVTGSAHTVKVWDAVTGRDILTLKGQKGPVSSVAFSPDGTRLATGGRDDHVAKVWDAVTGKEILTLKGHESEVNGIAFSPDGTRLATGSHDHTAKIWDAVTGKEILTLKGHKDVVYTGSFSPDGKRIITCSYDRTAKVWDATTGRETLTLKGHQFAIYGAVFSPDGARIATASHDGTARIWDASTGQEVHIFKGHLNAVYEVAFSPDGTRIVTCGDDSTARVWDAVNGQDNLTLKAHERQGTLNAAAVFSPDNKRIVTSFDDIVVWDSGTGQAICTLDDAHASSIIFSPDSKRIITGDNIGRVKVWDAMTGKEVLVLRGLENERIPKIEDIVRIVALSPDGKLIVTSREDGTTKVWDAITRQDIATLGQSDASTSIVFSPDSKRVVMGDYDGRVTVWNALTGQLMLTLRHSVAVYSVAFSQDGKRLATGDSDGIVTVWDIKTKQNIATLKGHESDVVSVAFSPDGNRVVSGGIDDTARVWDVVTEQMTLILRGHSSAVEGVAFSPDGRRVVTASTDGTAKIWNAETLQEISGLDYFQFGVGKLSEKRYQEAVDAFTTALRVNPQDTDALAARGFAYLGLNNVDAAIGDCSNAIRVDPKNVTALHCRGYAFLKKGDVNASLAEYVELLRLDPVDAVAHYNLACVYSLRSATYPKEAAGERQRRSDVDLALKHLEQAIKEGYKDREQMTQDSDLNPIKNDPRFAQIMRR
jgi:WD40 repeat protein